MNPALILKGRFAQSLVRKGSVTQDIALSSVSTIATLINGTIVVLVIGRLLPVQVFGEIVFASAIGNLAMLLPGYGFELQVVREVAQKRLSESQAFVNIVAAKLLLTLVAAAAVQLYMTAIHMPGERRLLVWTFVLYTFINSFTSFNGALRKGKGDFTVDARVWIVRTVVFCALVAVSMIFFRGMPLSVGLAYLASGVLGLVMSLSLCLPKMPDLVWRTSWSAVRGILRTGLPFALQIILSTIYFQIDTLMVERMLDIQAVGYYQAAVRLVVAVIPFAMLLINAFYPRIAAGFNHATQRLDGRYPRQMLGLLALTGLAGTLGFSVLARPLIPFLYGAKMAPSIAVLQVFSLVLVVRFIAGGLSIVLMSVHRQHILVWAAGAATVINISLNLLMIPGLGMIGSAWANVLTNLFMLIVYAIASARFLFGRQAAEPSLAQ